MNNEKNILVIASYPPQGTTDHKKVVGGASYTKRTLLGLYESAKMQRKKISLTVLAEQFNGKETYTDRSITVKRIWKRNSLFSYISLLRNILSDTKTNHIVIGFELSMFGEKLSLLPFLPFLFLLRLFGKRVSIIFHQVILDFSELHGHMNLEKDSFKTKALGFALRQFYRGAGFLASDSIVFEEALKKRLLSLGNTKPITVIPLPIEEHVVNVQKEDARKKLHLPQDKFIMLSFGFLAWYKGTDWLVAEIKKATHNQKKDILLVLAGGPNPNHETKAFYQKYVQEITSTCKSEGILLTGFVSEKQMPLYFQASDLVLFPYRAFMSSSAPLTLAYTFEKPFLLAEPLRDMLSMQDIEDALVANNLTKETLLFSHKDTFVKTIKSLQKDTNRLKNMHILSRTIKQKRTWNLIGKKYFDTLTA